MITFSKLCRGHFISTNTYSLMSVFRRGRNWVAITPLGESVPFPTAKAAMAAVQAEFG